MDQYNREWPHQGLAMKVPADVYARSARVYRGLEALTYPFHDATFTVTQCGRICFKARKVNLSHVFAGQNVGGTQVGERVWLVTFMRYDLGYFDDETCRLEPIDNPFGPGPRCDRFVTDAQAEKVTDMADCFRLQMRVEAVGLCCSSSPPILS